MTRLLENPFGLCSTPRTEHHHQHCVSCDFCNSDHALVALNNRNVLSEPSEAMLLPEACNLS